MRTNERVHNKIMKTKDSCDARSYIVMAKVTENQIQSFDENEFTYGYVRKGCCAFMSSHVISIGYQSNNFESFQNTRAEML